MSDTPETNAAEERCIKSGFKTGYVDVEFALQLERDRDRWKKDCLEQAELNGKGVEREAALFDALRGLLFFCEEDQSFASKAYAKTFNHAKRLVQSRLGAQP